MSNNNNSYNVRNILVPLDKLDFFLKFYQDNLIDNCPFKFQPYKSGQYMVFTLDNVHDEERQLIRDFEKSIDKKKD